MLVIVVRCFWQANPAVLCKIKRWLAIVLGVVRGGCPVFCCPVNIRLLEKVVAL